MAKILTNKNKKSKHFDKKTRFFIDTHIAFFYHNNSAFIPCISQGKEEVYKIRYYFMRCVFIVMPLFLFIATAGASAQEVGNNGNSANSDIVINEHTAPEIRAKYAALNDAMAKQQSIKNEYHDKLQENYELMREKETSLENRTIGAVGIGTVGIGGMMVGEALSEQNADEDIEQEMRAHLESFRCEYGNYPFVRGGTTNVELPGGNDLFNLYAQYAKLANDLKLRKESLGLKPGIESEIVLDKSETGLYDDVGTGIVAGSYISVARAILNPNSPEAAAWTAQKNARDDKLKTGAVVAGIGTIGSAIANYEINKDAPQESSAQIKTEYEAQLASADQDVQSAQSELDAAIENNSHLVQQYNDNLTVQQALAQHMQDPYCNTPIVDDIDTVLAIQPLSDKTTNVSDAPKVPNLSTFKTDYDYCVTCITDIFGEYDFDTNECVCTDPYPDLVDGVCTAIVDTPIYTQAEFDTDPDYDYEIDNFDDAQTQDVVDSIIATSIVDEGGVNDETPDENQCPSHNPRLTSITSQDRVSGFCKYGHVKIGKIYKIKSGADVGTCSCTATECDTGYKLVKGVCKECDTDNGYEPDDKGNCIKNTTAIAATTSQTDVENSDTPDDDSTPSAPVSFYHVCSDDKDKNLDKPKYCIGFFRKIKVTPLQASGLAKEYVKTKEFMKQHKISKPDDIVCASDTDSTINKKIKFWTDDYMPCTSKNLDAYYEFQFNSLNTGDGGITRGIAGSDLNKGICMLFGLNYQILQTACQTSDAKTCSEIDAMIKRSFYSDGGAEIKSNTCVIHESNNMISSFKLLGDLNMIDNVQYDYFHSNVNINSSERVITEIANYLDANAGPLETLKCDNSFVHDIKVFPGTKEELEKQSKTYNSCIQTQIATHDTKINCNTISPTNMSKSGDLLPCTYNGHKVDFLFNDLDETWGKKSRAGYEAMSCKVIAGQNAYTGKSCSGMTDSKTCTEFGNKLKANDSSSKGTKWDDKNKVCILLDSRGVARTTKTLEVTGMIAGTALALIGGGEVMIILVAVEATSIAANTATDATLSNWILSFLNESNKCKEEKCANDLLKKHIARIRNALSVATEPEQEAISSEIQRLIGLLSQTTFEEMIEKAATAKILSEDAETEPDTKTWTKVLLNYYNTELTSAEKAVVATNKITNVTQFATLFGMGIMSGMRLAVTKFGARISEATATKWVKLKILRPSDIGKITLKTTTTSTARVAMTPTQATRLAELEQQEARITAELGKNPGSRRAADLRHQLTTVRQERNTILNQLGNPTEAELAAMRVAAEKQGELARAEQELASARKELEEYNAWAEKNPGAAKQGNSVTRKQTLEKKVADAEKRVADLGGDTTTTAATTSKETAKPETEAKPAPKTQESSPAPKESAEPEVKTTTKAGEALEYTAGEERAITRLNEEKTWATSHGLASPRDEQIIDIQLQYVEEAGKATTEAQMEKAFIAYHQRIVDYTSKLFNRSKTISVAKARRAEYLNVIASDENLFAQSQRWATLSQKDKEQFLRTVLERADKKFGSGKPIDIEFGKVSGGGAGGTDYDLGGKINISLQDYAPLGLHPSKNLDDAMQILSHEHAHNILLNAPAKSSVPEDVVSTILVHSEDDTGVFAYMGGKQLKGTRNYDKLLHEQEGKLIGQEVGNGFSTELRQLRAQSAPASASKTGATGTRTTSATTAKAAEAQKALRAKASKSFEQYASDVKAGKQNPALPKSRLTDSEWTELSKQMESEGIVFREETRNGTKYMAMYTPEQLRAKEAAEAAEAAAKQKSTEGAGNTRGTQQPTNGANAARSAEIANFSPTAQQYINEIEELGKTREYVVIKGVGSRNTTSPLTAAENNYINQLLQGRDDLVAMSITQGDGAGGTLGANRIIVKKTSDMYQVETSSGMKLYRNVATKNVANLKGKTITTINGKSVFLEQLDNGGYIGNVSGRPVVVVNYDGHKIPFYASSGSAGKLDVPTGKWEVFFGFGKDGWFNKADLESIINHYDSPELKKIAQSLDDMIGDQRNVEDVFATISRKAYNGKGNVGRYDGPAASKDFINDMLDFTPVSNDGSTYLLLDNIEHVKGYFKTSGTRATESATEAAASTPKKAYSSPKTSVVGPESKTAQVAQDMGFNITDPSKMSDEDLAYYILKKKYAPRDQSMASFKQMGTPEEISARAKELNWVSWDDVERMEILNMQRSEYLMNNREAMDIWQAAERGTTMDVRNALVAEQHPDYKRIIDEMDELKARGVPQPGEGFSGNYSTADIAQSKQSKEYVAQLKKAEDDIKIRKNELNTMINNQEMSQPQAQQEFDKFVQNTKLQTKADITRALSASENLDERTVEYIDQIQRIIDNSSELSYYKNNFANLTNEQKQEFARSLMQHLERANGVSNEMLTTTVKITDETKRAAVHPYEWRVADKSGNWYFIKPEELRTDHRIVGKRVELWINPNDLRDYDVFMEDIAHETSHALDFANPNATAMSAQKLDIAEKSTLTSYVVEEYGLDFDLYASAQTEQAAHNVNKLLGGLNNPYKTPETLVTNSEHLEALRKGNVSLTLTPDNTNLPIINYHFNEIQNMLLDEGIGFRRIPETTNQFRLFKLE